MDVPTVAVALTVGTDALLLHTRNQILRKYGVVTVSTNSAQEAFEVFQSGDFDFVLLCHTIPEAEREQLVAQIRRRSASTPVISVSDIFHQEDPFADATTINDPNTMLRDIGRVAGLSLPIDQA